MKQDQTESKFRKKLDSFSSSFCAAKWWNSTIWLGSGQTTSCHHPPWNDIPKKVIENPKLLHNTKEKKKDRKKMLAGKRPKGCDYCWKVQDANPNNIPDRVYKSMIYTDDELQEAFSTKPKEDVNLKTLEVSFDRTCNFACSYCNPSFSTTWVKDINKNGPYVKMVSKGSLAYVDNHPQAQKFKSKNVENPYVTSFWSWWESDLKYSLQELRVTGGEPTLSPELWKLLDRVSVESKDNLNLKKIKIAINSNLGAPEEVFKKLKVISKKIPNFDLYTSCEARGAHADYIRDGLNYKEWFNRLTELEVSADFKMISVMATINALCLWSLTDLIDDLLKLRMETRENDGLSFTLNILRFPSFQSCLVLPVTLRKSRQMHLQKWLDSLDEGVLYEHETNHMKRLIVYLGEPEPKEIKKLRKDFKLFYDQYDQRRGKSFKDTFPKELTDWYMTL